MDQQENKKAFEYSDKAMQLYYAGSLNEALVYSTLAIDLFPNSDFYNNRSIIYLKLNQYNQSLSDVNRAIEINSTNYLYYKNRSSIFSKQNKYENALDNLNYALSLNRKDPELYSDRSLIYSKLKKYELALNDIDYVLIKFKNYNKNNVLLLKAIIFTRMGKFEKSNSILNLLVREPDLKEICKYYLGINNNKLFNNIS